eukprot:8240489-Prorocentrum_lima.AAC.1
MEHVGRAVPTMPEATVAVVQVDAAWQSVDAASVVASNLVVASVVAYAARTVAEIPQTRGEPVATDPAASLM